MPSEINLTENRNGKRNIHLIALLLVQTLAIVVLSSFWSTKVIWYSSVLNLFACVFAIYHCYIFHPSTRMAIYKPKEKELHISNGSLIYKTNEIKAVEVKINYCEPKNLSIPIFSLYFLVHDKLHFSGIENQDGELVNDIALQIGKIILRKDI